MKRPRNLPEDRLVVGVVGHGTGVGFDEKAAMRLIGLAFDNIMRWHPSDVHILALDAVGGAGVASLSAQVAHQRGWPVEQYDGLHASPVPYHVLVKLGGDNAERELAEAFRQGGPVYEYAL